MNTSEADTCTVAFTAAMVAYPSCWRKAVVRPAAPADSVPLATSTCTELGVTLGAVVVVVLCPDDPLPVGWEPPGLVPEVGPVTTSDDDDAPIGALVAAGRTRIPITTAATMTINPCQSGADHSPRAPGAR
jgi:hypothetical protein